jgi:uncharacterized protein YndB with AHSA1/START domain
MTGLFSHPPAAGDELSDRQDLRVTVSVPAPVDHAWAGLTEHLHLWWPADELSRWGEGSFFDLEDNALVETSAQDDENVWGEVVDSRPGQWLDLKWRHAGSDSTTELRLEMTPDGSSVKHLSAPGAQAAEDADRVSGATLDLTHSGWTSGDPQDLYDFYRQFWPSALGRYRRFMGGS